MMEPSCPSIQTKIFSGVGIDPTAAKFQEYYEDGIELIPDFFSAKKLGEENLRSLPPISMFYDLEDPMLFVNEVKESLAEDGIWHFEQSYMPTMIRQNSYDTICHEHVEYYSLTPVANLLEKAGLRIIDVKMNGVNGGSFAVSACHRGSL